MGEHSFLVLLLCATALLGVTVAQAGLDSSDVVVGRSLVSNVGQVNNKESHIAPVTRLAVFESSLQLNATTLGRWSTGPEGSPMNHLDLHEQSAAEIDLKHWTGSDLVSLSLTGIPQSLGRVYLQNLPVGSLVTYFPHNSTGGRLVGERGIKSLTSSKITLALDAISSITAGGALSHFVLDMSEIASIDRPIHLGSVEVDGMDHLQISSLAGYFPALRLPHSLESVTVLGGNLDESFHLGLLPTAFSGSIHITGGSGDDSIDIVEEQSDYTGLKLTNATVTVHKALVNICPVDIDDPAMDLVINTVCACPGAGTITINVRTLVVSITGTVQTDSGTLSLRSTNGNGLTINGLVQTLLGGDIIIFGASTMATGITLAPTGILMGSGDTFVDGVGDTVGLFLSGSVSLISGGSSTAFFGGSSTANGGAIRGITISSLTFASSNYDVNFNGVVPTLSGSSVYGAFIDSSTFALSSAPFNSQFTIASSSDGFGSDPLQGALQIIDTDFTSSFMDITLRGTWTSNENFAAGVRLDTCTINGISTGITVVIDGILDALSDYKLVHMIDTDVLLPPGSNLSLLGTMNAITASNNHFILLEGGLLAADSILIDGTLGLPHGGSADGVTLSGTDVTCLDLTILGEAGIHDVDVVALEMATISVANTFTLVATPQLGAPMIHTGLLVSGCDITAGNLDWTVPALDITFVGEQNVGLEFAGVNSVMLTSGTISTIFVGGIGKSSIDPGTTQNHGALIGGSLSIDAFADLSISATSGLRSHDSNGIYLTGDLTFASVSGAKLTLEGFSPDQGTLPLPNIGFLLEGSVTASSGVVVLRGEVAGGDVAGRHGLLALGVSTMTVGTSASLELYGKGGDGGNSNGIELLGPVSTIGSAMVVMDGEAGPSGGIGIIFTDTFSPGGSGSTLSLRGVGGGSSASSNSGVLFPSAVDLAQMDTTIVGFGGGTGTSSLNYGVAIMNDFVLGADLVITGTGGLGTGGSNDGVLIGGDVTVGGVSSVSITGNASSGLDSNGVFVANVVNAPGSSISIVGNTLSLETDCHGVLIDEDITAGLDLIITGSSAGASGSEGVQVRGNVLTLTAGTAMDITGTASGTVAGGVNIFSVVELLTTSAFTINIVGTGFRGVSLSAISLNTLGTLDVTGFGQAFGITLTGNIDSPANRLTLTGSATATSNARGIFFLAGIISAPALTMVGSATGESSVIGILLSGGGLSIGGNIDITGTVENAAVSMPNFGAGVVVDMDITFLAASSIVGANLLTSPTGSLHRGVIIQAVLTAATTELIQVTGSGSNCLTENHGIHFVSGSLVLDVVGAQFSLTGSSFGGGSINSGVVVDPAVTDFVCTPGSGCSIDILGSNIASGSAVNRGIDFQGSVTANGVQLNIDGDVACTDCAGVAINGLLSNAGNQAIIVNGICFNIGCDGIAFLGSGAIYSATGSVQLTGISGGGTPITFNSAITFPSKVSNPLIFLSEVVFKAPVTFGGLPSSTFNIIFDQGFSIESTQTVVIEDHGLDLTIGGPIVIDTFGSLELEASAAAVLFSGSFITSTAATVIIARPLFLSSSLDIDGPASSFDFLTIDGNQRFQITGAGCLMRLNGNVGDSGAVFQFLIDSDVIFGDGCTSVTAIDGQVYARDAQFDYLTPRTMDFNSDFAGAITEFYTGMSDSFGDLATVIVRSPSITFGDAAYNLRGPIILTTALASGSASIEGTFLSSFTINGPFAARSTATFNRLSVLASATINPGFGISDTGCFTTTDFEMDQSSTFIVNFEPSITPCTGFDQVTVFMTSTLMLTDASLSLVGSGPPVRGERYFILKGHAARTGEFSNAPEGDVVTVSGVAMTITYLLDETLAPGSDVSLLANSLPNTNPDSYVVIAPTITVSVVAGVLANDNDPEMVPLTAALVSQPPLGEGLVTLNADGSFFYDAGIFTGVTVFTYEASDGLEASAPTMVTLTVILPSPSPSSTPSRTMSETPSSSTTSTSSLTATPTPSSTTTFSATRTITPTGTPTQSSTSTGTGSTTASMTTSRTPSSSSTATPSMSGTPTPTFTPSSTGTPSSTFTLSATTTSSLSATMTSSDTPTAAATMTASVSRTETPSSTLSGNPTTSETATLTPSASSTFSAGATPSSSGTATATPAMTMTASISATTTKTTTISPTETFVKSASTTVTSTASTTLSASQSPSLTVTSLPTVSPSGTISGTSTSSPSASMSASDTLTSTRSASETLLVSSSMSLSESRSASGTATASLSFSSTGSSSETATLSPSPTVTTVPTTEPTPSSSASQTPTGTSSSSSSETGTPSATNTPPESLSATTTSSLTPSLTPTSSLTISAFPTRSSTLSVTPSATPIVVPNDMISATVTPSKSQVAIAAPAVESAQPTRSPSPTVSTSRTVISEVIIDLGGGNMPNQQASSDTPSFDGVVDEGVPVVAVLPGGEVNLPVIVRSTDGREVARVSIPDDISGTLVISQPNSDVVTVPEVSSDVLDVTVVGADGELIRSFDEPIELCFSSDGSVDEGDVCLGFFNEDNEWECEDYCLQSSSDRLCGETDHLTNFALLLDSSAGSDGKCGSESTNYLFIYLSIGAVGLALIIIVIAVIFAEIRIRRKAFKTNKSLTRAGSLATSSLASQ